ncbi:MAG: FtsX-like permease family protein [Acidobacteria bacterium]|nr:FtsX-like permease family protein [Acidobacteriota bacterium]
MNEPRPNRFWGWLLSLVVHADDRCFARDDLADGFETRLRESGASTANSWYRQQVVRSLLPSLRDRWVRRPRVLGALLMDVPFAIRSLAKTPGVVTITIISLAVGIGATTAVFSVGNAMFRPTGASAVSEPDTLVAIFTTTGDGDPYGRSSIPDVREVESAVDALTSVATHRFGLVEVVVDDHVATSMIEIVSGNYFDVLGTTLVRGRGFQPAETTFGQARRVVVVSERMWRERLGNNPDVIGESIEIDGDMFEIVGVAPDELGSRTLALRVEAWVPIGIPGGIFLSTEEEWASRGNRDHGIVARLADGANRADATAQLDVVASRLHSTYPDEWITNRETARGFTMLSERDSRVPPSFRTALATASGLLVLAAALVLAIACFNVASLLLARTDARRQEMAVRLALGARRRRIVFLLLTESVMLGSVACALGVALAHWLVGRFDTVSLPIGNFSVQFDIGLDSRVLIFAGLVAMLTSIGFGLLPARRGSRPDLVPALKGVGDYAGAGAGKSRFRSLLIVGQVAGAVIFVVGAGTSLRSFDELAALDWGVDAAGVAVMSKDLPVEMAPAERDAEYRDLLAGLRDRPEIDEVQLGTTVEGTTMFFENRSRVSTAGYEPAPGESTRLLYNAVTPGYIEMMGIRVVGGRTFTSADDFDAARVAVVNESFAERFWPGEPALGQTFRLARTTDDDGFENADTAGAYTVIGIAADARYEGFETTQSEYFWTSLLQNPPARTMIVVRAKTGIGDALQALREELPADERAALGLPPSPLSDIRDLQFSFLRVIGQLLAAAGVFGLFLAALGLYGTVAFAVTRRGRELAIRQAVGALPGQVVSQVFRSGMLLAAVGLVLGIAVVVPLVALLRAELQGVAPVEVLSLLVGVAVALAVTAAASYIPARRAVGITPVEALRAE